MATGVDSGNIMRDRYGILNMITMTTMMPKSSNLDIFVVMTDKPNYFKFTL